MSMQKGKHQSGQTQGFPRYTPAYFSHTPTPQRPDVSFHVPSGGFPQQQGGGAGPPSTTQMRTIHHSHHGGNPSIAPPHQQQPPQQAQSQHTGGPPGPAPTSTPPGPTDMGKQGPPHMQGQPSLQQGGPMQMNFVANQSRTGGSQQFYSAGPRGPGPRMPNRGQVVSMQTNNVGQQMYPPHVQVPQVSVFGQIPAQVHTPQLFMQSQLPMYASQPRHGNSTGSGYYAHTPPQQILMAPPQVYTSFQHPSQSPQYYYPSHVSLPQRGGGVTGGPGPGGLAGAASQTVMPGGGPPAQMGQPGAPVMSLVQTPGGGGVVGVAGLSAGDSTTGQTTASTTGKQTRRKHALDIIDPKTMKNVDIYDGIGASSSTPPRSGESSARGTPQPTTSELNVAADFAARVAKAAASGKSPPSSPPSVAQVGPTSSFVESPTQVVTANGPDPSGTNSISLSEGISQSDAHAISNQQIVVEESSNLAPRAPPTIPTVTGLPSTWKQGQLPHSTSTSLGSKSSGNNSSKSDISNQAVADEKEIESQVAEFVPSVSAADMISSSPTATIKDMDSTPVVSAQTNAPTVDVVRNNRENSRESFPALKSSAQVQSPRRKHVPQPAVIIPQATTTATSPSTQPSPPMSTTSRETTPIAETKATKKPSPVEDSTPSSPFPVPQPPKEKRDQEKPHGRDREKSSSISSQGRSEREKSVSSTSSSSSQHHGRDREKSSREKDKSSSAPQGGQKDRDKSASQGRDRDKSSMKEATPPVSSSSVLPQPQVEQLTSVTVEEPKQQTNGEMTAADTTEGKASQRSKSKQSRHHKMRDRDINRKGAEKEGGSDMDAFVEPSAEEATPPVLPTVPSQSSVPATQSNKVVDNQTVKDEEAEVDEEEKLVAARNEENNKVSAAALSEDASSSTPLIETTPAVKPAALSLKHEYKDDQWSPLNPEGKKKYERDFLMELQNDPQSKKKPHNLPDIEIVLKDNTNRQRMTDRPFASLGRPVPERSPHDAFTPGFMRQPNQRQAVPKRNSQQGSKAKGNKSNPIHITLSLKEDVKLHETENAWKPGRMKSLGNNEQDAKTEDLYKKVRGVLNKLTPQKFSTLVSQVQSLPIDNSERLQGVIDLVFEKAVDEPSFSVAYAQMCKLLSGMQVPAERKNKDDTEFVNFRKLLVTRCQVEFEKNSEAELNRGAKQKEIEQTTDPEKKKELQLNFEEEERRIRMKSVGNIRFIGELFKLGMLTTNIMQRCIKHLLSEGDEESLECLCKLLTTIGKDLESKHQDLTQYFNKMRDISQRRGQVSSRVRFMLQDAIDLRTNNWVPRRDESNPKTMDQIQKEAETERLDQQIMLNSAASTPRRQDDRASQNRKGRGGGIDEDGWNKVTTTSRTSRYTVDTTKLKPKEGYDQGAVFGASSIFQSFAHGANMKGAKDPAKKPMAPPPSSTYNTSNMYAALDNSNDDGRRPPSLSSRSTTGKTPSSSIEKERMLAPFRNPAEENRQSRGGTSRSSSRDNSSRRNAEESGSVRSFASSSQPVSVSASSEDISGTKSPALSSAVIIPTLTLEEVQKKTLNLLEEFLLNNNYKESGELISETFSTENLSIFVRESLNDMLERKSSARQNVGGLLSHVVKAGIITLPIYLAGLNEFLECADDIAIDVPKFWPYLAEVIVPMLLSEAMSFANLRDLAQPSHGKLILEILQLLVKDKGPLWIREKWVAAGIKWTDFLPSNQVDDFIKQNNLEYTVSGAVPSPLSSSTAMNWDHVQQKLEEFLKPEQVSPPSFDQICDWIGANVGDQVKEPKFIRALMTAICWSAIDSQKTTMKLNEPQFQQHQKLLLKYVDNNEALELQCLYAVQSLITKLEHPQGLLCQIFQVLWDDGTISNDSFIAWESSTDPAEQGGKGVAHLSLTTFFTALREGEEDSSCEES